MAFGEVSAQRIIELVLQLQLPVDALANVLEMKPRQTPGISRGGAGITQEDDISVEFFEATAAGAQDQRAEPAQVLALEIPANRRAGAAVGLPSGRDSTPTRFRR